MRPPRLDNVWIKNPVYFITTCVDHRRPLLNNSNVFDILTDEWARSMERHHWAIGRYVIMPDHVHFFATTLDNSKSLPKFIGSWKEWSSKRIRLTQGGSTFRWQKGFFDHVLRNPESRSQKWDYVKMNPVRAKLVDSSKDWPFQGFVHFE